MGFESPHAARRRLAALAMSNEHVQEALAPSLFADFEVPVPKFSQVPAKVTPIPLPVTDTPASQVAGDVVHHLDELAHDIVATPGAGGALLVAFAAQARALTLVMEAAVRSQGVSLPADVIGAVQAALRMPSSVAGLEFAWHP